MAPINDDFSEEWRQEFMQKLRQRPAGLTEVRRDGKDDDAVRKVIMAEFRRRLALDKKMSKKKMVHRMNEYAAACWATMETMHKLFLDDDQPENEKARLDPDHWYENNLTNATLFANLTVENLPQLVPGRLFSTRMPRNIVKDYGERNDFLHKVKVNNLKVACVLTEPHEFEKYSGTDALLEFYREECGLIVYNRHIPDFDIPTSGDLVNNILDLTYHLAKGRNCLVHCAGGSGRTGMVIAAVIKNLGVYDPVARVRRVKSTYVETMEQEIFLKNFPKALDSRIVREIPLLAKAIAAEHLIQVFHTFGTKLENKDVSKSADVVEAIDDEEENKLKAAYMETFDLIDADGSGTVDKKELMEWMEMCGAELDVSKITDVLLKEGDLTRDRFADLMCSFASSSRRDYDIGGPSMGGGHH